MPTTSPAITAVPTHGYSYRAAYAVGSSLCLGLPAFSEGVHDPYPIRSPLVIADYLIDHAKGKTFAEIGTRNGDVSKCVSQFTKRAFAIEVDERHCARLVQRGIDVECKRFENVDDGKLLGVDVFFWFVWPPILSENWLRRLWTLPRPDNTSTTTTVLVAFDGHIPEDMRFLPLFVSHYGGSVDRIFFDEGGEITSGRRPSYSHVWQYRPGRWGVIHVAKFRLGGLEPRKPPGRLDRRLVLAIHENVTTGWTWTAQGWRAGTRPLPTSLHPPQRG